MADLKLESGPTSRIYVDQYQFDEGQVTLDVDDKVADELLGGSDRIPEGYKFSKPAKKEVQAAQEQAEQESAPDEG